MTEWTPQGWIAPKRPKPQTPDDRQEDMFPESVTEPQKNAQQSDLFQAADDRERALIDKLIADTRLYATSGALKELLDFIGRMKNIPPFNAMLLHIQKPGLSYAMTSKDWWVRFRRNPKQHARPLIIMRSFGPVDFVFDVLDTEGEPLPESAYSFPTIGKVPGNFMSRAAERMEKSEINVVWLDKGDRHAGWAKKLTHHVDPKRLQKFEIGINKNHPAEVQFVSLAHELAHIFLGHCGEDKHRKLKGRWPEDISLREVEAETVAYVVAKRSDISPKSETYLNQYQGAFEALDLHLALKCAKKIEQLLGLPLGLEKGNR